MKAIEVLEQARKSGIKVTEDRNDPRYPLITFSWQGGSIAAMEIKGQGWHIFGPKRHNPSGLTKVEALRLLLDMAKKAAEQAEKERWEMIFKSAGR